MSSLSGMMTNEEKEDMEKNRLHMINIKKWFEFGASFELWFILYCAMAAPFPGLVFSAAGLIYLLMIAKKDKKIIKAAILGHIAAAVFMVSLNVFIFLGKVPVSYSSKIGGISEMMICSNAVSFQYDTEEDDMIAISQDEGTDFAEKYMMVMKIINLSYALVSVLPPVFINAVLLKKRNEYYSMSDKPGFPYFKTFAENRLAFKKAEDQRILERIKKTYDITEYSYASESATGVLHSENELQDPVSEENSSFINDALNNEGAQYLKKRFSEFREQLTKTPENIYDYTIFSSYIAFIIGVTGLHISSFLYAAAEVFIFLFAMLPKNIKLICAACFIHAAEVIMIAGSGPVRKDAAGIIIFIFVFAFSITQTVMYIKTFRMLSAQREAAFEMNRIMIRQKMDEERKRKIQETEEYYRQKMIMGLASGKNFSNSIEEIKGDEVTGK